MSIIIVGSGEMGYHLARRFSYEKRDVVVIDRHPDRVNFIQDNLDVHAIVGSGSSPAVLKEAGIRDADILVAVTDSDEVNLVACFVAGHLNRKVRKVARLRQEDYFEDAELTDSAHLGVDLIVSPENEAVEKLIRVLQVPSATDVINFAQGRIKLYGIQLREESPLVGQSLMNLRVMYPDERLLIAAIVRESEVIIPRGQDRLHPRDQVYVISSEDEVGRIMEMTGRKERLPENFMILGGTPIGVKTASRLEKQGARKIRLIEANRTKCERIASELEYTTVLHAETVDEDFLTAEGISEVHAFLALSDDEEHNALTALLAKTLGADRVAALTNRGEYHRLLSAIGVDIVVNPRLEGASRVLQYLRKGKVISVSMLPGEVVEAIEFEAVETCPIVGKPLRKIRFPGGSLLGAVERDRRFFIPNGESVIQAGDTIIVFAKKDAVAKVEKLVTVSSHSFFS